jgi:hypothetical protein
VIGRRGGSSNIRFALAALLSAASTPYARADDAAAIGDLATVRDFLIQNVCLDVQGKVIARMSPVDGNPACVAQRDLRAGEPLPYHKHDHPSPDQRDAPLGYQRHDSFPVDTAAFGQVVEHSFDFGVGERRRFGVFDPGSDGADIVVLSPGRASIAATEDGGAGFQLFVGECTGAIAPDALTHSWIIAEFPPDAHAPLQGETVARLNNLTAGQQDGCPTRFNAAFTRWHVAPFRYRAARGQGTPVTLTTLISDHYGGGRPETADHVERFYFTRELGGARWERWQNANGNRQLSSEEVRQAAERYAGTGRCSDAPVPEGGAPMLLVDCREWSRIVPASESAGDRPGFFIDVLRQRTGIPEFFAPPDKAK